MTPLPSVSESSATLQGQVRDVMTADPVTVTPATSVREAQRLMQHHRIRHLPVCADGRLVGLVSEGDVRLVLPSPATSLSVYELPALLERLTVAEIMTPFPVTIGPAHAVMEAVNRLLSHRVEALPVTDNRRVVGMLTRTDLLYAFVRAHAALPLAA